MKKVMTIKLPPTKAIFMPVGKANQRMKSEKDYTRKDKHKKKWD
jgi:hypothetical protein